MLFRSHIGKFSNWTNSAFLAQGSLLNVRSFLGVGAPHGPHLSAPPPPQPPVPVAAGALHGDKASTRSSPSLPGIAPGASAPPQARSQENRGEPGGGGQHWPRGGVAEGVCGPARGQGGALAPEGGWHGGDQWPGGVWVEGSSGGVGGTYRGALAGPWPREDGVEITSQEGGFGWRH